MTIQDDYTSQTGGQGDSQGGAASAAADQGKHLAGTAKDEATNVAGTAAEQARSVVGDARRQVTSQLSDQATTQRDNLTQVLRSLGDDLQQMAENGPGQGMANDLAREVSDRARALGSHLEGREPGDLLQDARDFARRRPGTFLLGALAAGVVAGRLFRATADGAAAASLDQPATGTTGLSTPVPAPRVTPTESSAGYGTPASAGYGTESSTDSPGTTGYDTPVVDPTLATPASTDSTSSGLPGQQTQDKP
ncbi:hypothetical protein [Nocardioides zeicaulis]|uniref:DUF3618 domain-containing protein n=1 Tax=Nocardioides zeicaulis TaxID=1776857 RepID=A0ABV6DVY3_9ACTN